MKKNKTTVKNLISNSNINHLFNILLIMRTTVRSLLNTKKVDLFVNSFTPKYNLISKIILQRKQSSLLTCKDYRQKIENENIIVEKISANGDNIAFCENLYLFARQTK